MGRGCVILVGAGPHKDLLTIRGKQEVEQAEVVVYDDLIDQNILQYADPDAELLYVGKRYGHHSRNQEEINRLLVDRAEAGKRVLRLKGGDAFVFGRGGEELLALEAANIPHHVIPGISTCIAVPETFGIPVTHRHVAKSFTVITGHTADDLEENYEALARLDGTLVFMMSLHSIPQICDKLMGYGKDGSTPCAILSRGFHPEGRRVDGTLQDICSRLEGVVTPAIFLVGETATLHLAEPLAKVNVVGSEEFYDRFEAVASGFGLGTKLLCNTGIVPNPGAIPKDFSPYSHIAFTSGKSIDLFFAYLKRERIDYRRISHVKFACVGRKCAAKLSQYGFYADLIPETYSGEALARLLVEGGSDIGNVLLLRSEKGSKAFPRILEEANVPCTDAHLYTMEFMDIGDVPESDYTVFASGEGVRHYFESGCTLGASKAVSIGGVTKKVLGQYTNAEIITAETQSVEAVVDSILDSLS